MVIIVTIYDAKENDFTHHGLGGLCPTSCQITEEINGQYNLTMEHPKDPEGRWERIAQDRIIKASGPAGDQLFRIQSIQKSLEGIFTVTALHIFYDLLDNFLEDIYPTQKTGDEAIKAILAGCQYASGFSASSDITARNNARLVRMNPVAALIGDEDQAFINRWGGEIKRDNFSIAINSRVGEDRGVCIRYRKNLTGLNLTEDYSEVKTRIMATGLNENDTVFEIPEAYGGPYIDSSDHLNDYAHPKIGYAHYSDIKIGAEDEDGSVPYPSEYEAAVELKKRVAQLYDAGADIPKITLDVQLADLSQTAEYAEYAALETVRIGDTVRVVHEGLGVDYSLRLTTYTWDCLRGRYESVTLGIRPENLGDAINSTDIDLSILSEQVNNAVKVGEKYNKVYITHEEGFVAETADGNARTHMSGTDGFVAESLIGGKWAKVVITAGEPFSVFSGNELIGGVTLQDGELVFSAGRLADPDAPNNYAIIGKGPQSNDGHGLFLANNGQIYFRMFYQGGNTLVYANNLYQLYVENGIVLLIGGEQATLRSENGIASVAGKTAEIIAEQSASIQAQALNLSAVQEITPAANKTGYTGNVTLANSSGGYTTLEYAKGILVGVTQS